MFVNVVPEAMFALLVGGCAFAWRHASTFKTSWTTTTESKELSSLRAAAVSTAAALTYAAPQAALAAGDAAATSDNTAALGVAVLGLGALVASAGSSGGKSSAAPATKKTALKKGSKPVSKFATSTRPKVSANAKPLSPGSNYPATKNIQTQKSGFGSFLQRFQKADGKSKYGVPIFLPNGSVNPKYLAAERADMKKQSVLNRKTSEAKRKKLIAKGDFELAGYIKKRIGEVGSGQDYYQSGR
jgi:hypothetical protein